MQTASAKVAELQTINDLKPLLSTKGPCLTMYLPLSSAPNHQGAKENALQWKELIRTIQARSTSIPKAKEAIESILDFQSMTNGFPIKGKSLVVLRSPDVFRLTQLDDQVPARAEIGQHFFIRPMLTEMLKPKMFYILALSQKNIRLLRCSLKHSEEVPLPDNMPTNFDESMAHRKPDHNSIHRASAGPSSGNTKGVGGTYNTDREAKDEYLSHFFRQIDRGLGEIVRDSSDPVILAGVEYELALYHSITAVPNVVKESVFGAPNGLKSGEMHARAIDAINLYRDTKLDEALGEYNHLVGGGASNRMKDVIRASNDGRVLTLFISESLETIGHFDENTYAIKGRETGDPTDEELVNHAAVQTIRHAGQVFVVPPNKMPNGSPLAAIFRY